MKKILCITMVILILLCYGTSAFALTPVSFCKFESIEQMAQLYSYTSATEEQLSEYLGENVYISRSLEIYDKKSLTALFERLDAAPMLYLCDGAGYELSGMTLTPDGRGEADGLANSFLLKMYYVDGQRSVSVQRQEYVGYERELWLLSNTDPFGVYSIYQDYIKALNNSKADELILGEYSIPLYRSKGGLMGYVQIGDVRVEIKYFDKSQYILSEVDDSTRAALELGSIKRMLGYR